MNFNDNPNILNLNDMNLNINDNNNVNMNMNNEQNTFHPNMFQQNDNFQQNEVYNLNDFSQNNPIQNPIQNPIHNIINNQNGGNIDDDEGPNPVELDEFKNTVKSYLQIDNDIKKLRQTVKEKNNQKNVLMPKIMEFMSNYNIEDLNTQDGVLRYKKTFVKASLSQKNIKSKIIDFFDNSKKSEELTKYLFDDREKIEKISLRRLKK